MAEAQTLNARAFANIFWAIAKLKDKMSQVTASTPALLMAFPVYAVHDVGDQCARPLQHSLGSSHVASAEARCRSY
eukprot:36532-Amphidinium_carterae.1